MIIVSDTTPLHYLILIDRVDLLPALFGRVLATPAVIAELQQAETPEKVRAWIATRPAWLEVQSPTELDPAFFRLGPGEAEAISLAKELHADVLLIDERLGAKLARAEGLFVTGTLGVLKSAANRGLASLPEALDALGKTTYRHTPKLFEELLRGGGEKE